MVRNSNAEHHPSGFVDLDTFLETPQARGVPTPMQGGIALPHADRMVIVGIFADDSTSIREARLAQAVTEGIALGVDALRGARGSDFYLDVQGFRGGIFHGMLHQVVPGSFRGYLASYEETPLISRTLQQLQDLRVKAQSYKAMGIPTTVAQLIITDGYPNSDTATPKDFARCIVYGDYIVGMGVASSDERAATFRTLFKNMGIMEVMTPDSDPIAVRRAISQFSQSVASIGSNAA